MNLPSGESELILARTREEKGARPPTPANAIRDSGPGIELSLHSPQRQA